ncbi:MAG: uracil-DNA glycosylase family protein [Desulfobacterales bacterium]
MSDPSALVDLIDALAVRLERLTFGPPVTHVYNPLSYARKPYLTYLERFGAPPREILIVGMNPGPWGMIQTGIPFGEVEAVTGWMGIRDAVGRPDRLHPKRPVDGMACRRSEVSGRRLWGWARERFGSPERFFSRILVLNYCPLAFFDARGANITPDKLPAADRKPLLEVCNEALRACVSCYTPRHVIGVGRFAAGQASVALAGLPVRVGRITHPSPANPRANRGWPSLIESELSAMGIRL